MNHVLAIKLIRTDTTLDLSQKAEKGMLGLGAAGGGGRAPGGGAGGAAYGPGLGRLVGRWLGLWYLSSLAGLTQHSQAT